MDLSKVEELDYKVYENDGEKILIVKLEELLNRRKRWDSFLMKEILIDLRLEVVTIKEEQFDIKENGGLKTFHITYGELNFEEFEMVADILKYRKKELQDTEEIIKKVGR